MRILRWSFILTLLLMTEATSGTKRLSIPDTTGIIQGGKVTIAIRIDSTLASSDSVLSYQLQIQFNTYYLSLDSVISQGTLTGSFGSYNYNESSPGVLNIASAGSSPLTGAGVLLYLRFVAKQPGYASVYFTDTLHNFFNQNDGNPRIALKSGSISINALPSISVFPNTALLVVGETLQFGVSGAGKKPYQWSVTDTLVASIDTSGLLSALRRGLTKVVVVDSAGLVDTSGVIEVRSVKLNLRDTTAYAGSNVIIPVYTSSTTGFGIISGRITVTFNGAVVSIDSVIQAGTLLASYPASAISRSTNQADIAFAGATPLSGAGVLLSLRVVIPSSSTYGTGFHISQALFNEDILARTQDANLTVTALSNLTINPNSGEMFVGDTLRFTSPNAKKPIHWSTTDSTVGSIDSTGLLTAVKGGVVKVMATDSVGAKGVTGDIKVYDAFVDIPTTDVYQGSTVDVPFIVERLAPGSTVLSVQLRLSYDTTAMKAVAVLPGTLTPSWSFFSSGQVSIAGAGSTGFQAAGVLLKIRFKVSASLNPGTDIFASMPQFLFNEGTPITKFSGGYVHVVAAAAPLQVILVAPLNNAIIHADSVKFIWQQSSPLIDHYWLEYSADSLFASSTIDSSLTDTSKTVHSLVSNKTYWWKVRARNVSGWGPFSTVRQFEVSAFGPVIQLSSNSVSFGGVKVGQFKDTTVTVTNTGTDTLKITTITSDNAVFTVRPTTKVLLAGQSFQDTLRFTPTSGSVQSAKFLITSNAASSPDTIIASGTGLTIVAIQLSSNSVSFGGVKVGQFKDTTVTITNTGTDTVKITSITSNNAMFTVRPASRTLPPGQSFQDTLRFAPSSVSAQSGRVLISSNASSSPDTITVAGNGLTGVEPGGVAPTSFSLGQNYPNPFNPSTTITLTLPGVSHVTLSVFDMLGREVAVLLDGREVSEGTTRILWDGKNSSGNMVSSGIYFYRMTAAQQGTGQTFVMTKRMILLK